MSRHRGLESLGWRRCVRVFWLGFEPVGLGRKSGCSGREDSEFRDSWAQVPCAGKIPEPGPSVSVFWLHGLGYNRSIRACGFCILWSPLWPRTFLVGVCRHLIVHTFHRYCLRRACNMTSVSTASCVKQDSTYLWLVGNGRMVVIVVIIIPHSSIPY